MVYEVLPDGYIYLPEYDEILTQPQMDDILTDHSFASVYGWKGYFKGLRKVHVHQDPEPSVKPLPGVPEALSVAG